MGINSETLMKEIKALLRLGDEVRVIEGSTWRGTNSIPTVRLLGEAGVKPNEAALIKIKDSTARSGEFGWVRLAIEQIGESLGNRGQVANLADEMFTKTGLVTNQEVEEVKDGPSFRALVEKIAEKVGLEIPGKTVQPETALASEASGKPEGVLQRKLRELFEIFDEKRRLFREGKATEREVAQAGCDYELERIQQDPTLRGHDNPLRKAALDKVQSITDLLRL